MATIKFILQSKKNPSDIYLRLSISRKVVLRRKTGYIIDPEKWSDKTNLPIPGDSELKTLKNKLSSLSTTIEERLNNAITKSEEITGQWLQMQIEAIQGRKKKTDIDRLTVYIQHYIETLKFKEYHNGRRGATRATEQKYTTLKNKIAEFEVYKKKQYYVKDVDLKFRDEFLKYLTSIDKLGTNTTGRYIKFLKTVCMNAKESDIETSPKLFKIKGFTQKAEKIYLTFDELEKIENTKFTRPALENAKDWLLIGCYIGQRVSDLLTLTPENLNVRNGLKMIELIQKKTGKGVTIPMHPKVTEILEKKNGQFPDKISDQKFNEHLKDLCKLAGINAMVKGSVLTNIGTEDEPLWRKQSGVYPKHELATSHICRRSFASNFYGEMPTALLISITAHSTEQQFLAYIGKTTNDYAVQIAEYWNKQLNVNNVAPMVVLKNAQ